MALRRPPAAGRSQRRRRYVPVRATGRRHTNERRASSPIEKKLRRFVPIDYYRTKDPKVRLKCVDFAIEGLAALDSVYRERVS
ncbi:hypothetical protein EVAR_7114_1 [Eumeta japonica]|uniref:Uncharacterized protein n=1 Tax=Eumeta variegata TaxID=151549 RepID=A0A4C1U6F7_EUMVA|nr:hypothetical protein EVAR_7114_1 [Eumeta japonica]